jgi:hypothetical protein
MAHVGELRDPAPAKPPRAARGQSRQGDSRHGRLLPDVQKPAGANPCDHGIKFYGRQIALCANCRTAWEPVDGTLIWDPSDPSASFSKPCNNCAFRPESPEQADTAKWKEVIAKLRAGGTFHCHKGVPLDPEGEDGSAYPKDRPEKLRLCRGYLNALGKWWGAAEPDQSKAPGSVHETPHS